MEKQPLRIELRHFSQVFILGILFVTVLFAFQNCGGPLEGEDELASIANSAPYPFNGKADSLAFMSCVGATSYDQNSFFSYRLQAFKNNGSGLKLNSSFVSATGGYGPDQRAEVIRQQRHTQSGSLQFSIRSFDNYQTILPDPSRGATYSYANYPISMSDSSIADLMAGEVSGEYINAGLPAPINLDLDFLQSVDLIDAQQVLESGDGFLALNFAPKDSTRAVGPSGIDSGTSIYGQMLIPSFTKVAGISGATKNILLKVDEVDPESNTLAANWSCPTNLRFVIVRPVDVDRADVICNANVSASDPNPSDPVQKQRLNMLRRVLPFSDWAVDLQNNCIISKQAGLCYGTNSTQLNIAYPNTPQSSCNPTTSNGYGTCPHFVSICYK